MTRSQSYAADRSKSRNQPIVLFDGAEVEIFMADLSLFPVVPSPIIKRWEQVRSIVFGQFSAKAVEAEVLALVETPKVDYGFALLDDGLGGVTLGVFEKVVS